MIVKNKALKLYSLVRSGIMACLLPVFFIYIFVGKPDYKILDSLSGVVVPAAHFVADGVTFPFRMVDRFVDGVRARGGALRENRDLQAKLDDTIRQQNEYQVVLEENIRLRQQLGMIETIPHKIMMVRILHDHSAIAHNSFIIRAGTDHGIRPNMAIISSRGEMLGIVTSASATSAKVRGLSDAKSTIPVRVSGTDVYGFLNGNGVSAPSFDFYSDPEFVPSRGNRLVTSGIKGTLPDGIPVGIIVKVGRTSADVDLNTSVKKWHDVIVLLFDDGGGYK